MIGERFDADAGLQYLNARYYDPKLAMFIQPDWWEVMQAGVGVNRYGYSFNDPVNGMDPGGHETANNDYERGLWDSLFSREVRQYTQRKTWEIAGQNASRYVGHGLDAAIVIGSIVGASETGGGSIVAGASAEEAVLGAVRAFLVGW